MCKNSKFRMRTFACAGSLIAVSLVLSAVFCFCIFLHTQNARAATNVFIDRSDVYGLNRSTVYYVISGNPGAGAEYFVINSLAAVTVSSDVAIDAFPFPAPPNDISVGAFLITGSMIPLVDIYRSGIINSVNIDAFDSVGPFGAGKVSFDSGATVVAFNPGGPHTNLTTIGSASPPGKLSNVFDWWMATTGGVGPPTFSGTRTIGFHSAPVPAVPPPPSLGGWIAPGGSGGPPVENVIHAGDNVEVDPTILCNPYQLSKVFTDGLRLNVGQSVVFVFDVEYVEIEVAHGAWGISDDNVDTPSGECGFVSATARDDVTIIDGVTTTTTTTTTTSTSTTCTDCPPPPFQRLPTVTPKGTVIYGVLLMATGIFYMLWRKRR